MNQIKTQVVSVNPQDRSDIQTHAQKAAKVIQSCGLVAFPTETVYGLGADGMSEDAVRRIFQAKGRPADNPVILHIADSNDMGQYAVDIPSVAYILAERFWPGPLTLVLRSSPRVPHTVRANLETVTLRVPNHPVARELIRAAGVPIAAPSANISGRPSPTRVEHVLEDMDGTIEMILDAGPTQIGLESTVVDVTSDVPVVLRLGGLSLEALQDVIPTITAVDEVSNRSHAPRSPGLKYRHYAPKARVIIIPSSGYHEFHKKLHEQIQHYSSQGQNVGVISLSPIPDGLDGIQRHMKNIEQYAREVFDLFRFFDQRGVDVILAEDVEDRGIGRALRERLRKAAL